MLLPESIYQSACSQLRVVCTARRGMWGERRGQVTYYTQRETEREKSRVGREASALVESLNLPEQEKRQQEKAASRTRWQLDAEMYLFQPDDFKKR